MGAVELNELLIQVGICGWFPLGIFFLQSVVSASVFFLFLGNAMATHTPKFWCGDQDFYDNHNWTAWTGGGATGNGSVTTSSPENMTMLEICSIGCPSGNWTYAVPREHSMAAEWDLVCDREPLLNMTETLFYAGGLVACLFCGYLSDTYGRRRVVMASGLLCAVAGVQVFWIPNIYYYIAIRFFLGMGYVGMVSLTTYKCETFSSRHRFIPMLCDPGWTLTAMAIPLISYCIPNWRTFCLLIYATNLLVIPILFITPESPLWLVKKGRKREAFQILQGVAKSRGITLNEEDFNHRILRSEDDEEKTMLEMEALETPQEVDFEDSAAAKENPRNQNPFLNAISTKTVIFPLLIAGLYWSYSNLVYIGITFSYGSLPGSRHINFLLLQMTGLPARFLEILVCYYLNRRPSLGICYTLIGTCYIVIGICRCFVADIDSDLPLLRKSLNLVIKTVASVGWGVYSMWLQEAFPTLIRGRCYLIAMLFGRVAALFASYLSYFQKRTPLVVEMALGVAGVLVALGAFPISETQGEPLPQSLEDMEKMGKKTKVTECRLLKVKSERENRNGDDIKA